jgi:iron complex outermembrane receptor protein
VLHQNGWRDLQSSNLQNCFGDVGWRSERAEKHLNITMAHSALNGPGTAPVELLAAYPRAQFTAPNQITNQYAAVSLTGTLDVTDTTSIQGLAYYRYFLERAANGNAPTNTPCDDGSGLLRSNTGAISTTQGGASISGFLNGGQYSESDNQTTNTNAYGTSAQVMNIDESFGLRNHFVTSVSFDDALTLQRPLADRWIDAARTCVRWPQRADRRTRSELAGPCRDLECHTGCIFPIR